MIVPTGLSSGATNLRPLPDGAVVLQPLTARELQVLGAVAQGYSNALIAQALHITIDGVKFHLKSIYGKLGAERRSHAVHIAERSGLLRRGQAPVIPFPRIVRAPQSLSAGRLGR